MAIWFDQRVERLHQSPHGRVDVRGQARVHVSRWSTTPLLAGGHQLELDDPFRAEVDLDATRKVLTAERDDDTHRPPQRRFHIWLEHDL
jgi:hypothetical protein